MSGGVLSVVAVVENGGRESVVLNRRIDYVYHREGKNFVGVDGPFRTLLAYSPATPHSKAFAGSELRLKMDDGTVETVKDHWWASHIPGTAGVALGDADSLRKCYVFFGSNCIAPDDLRALRDAYTGPVYGYWEYEKHLKARTGESA